MQLIVVRHSSTLYNARNLINGQHDDSLSKKGLNELPGLVNSLKAYNFTSIYSSPLKRSLKTAEYIAEATSEQVKTDPRLMEINFGSFTSKNWDSMREVFGMSSTEMLNSYSYDFSAYGGESDKEVHFRVESFLRDILSDSNVRPLVVTHNGIIRWIDLICTKRKTTGLLNSSFNIYAVNQGGF
jgi:probable phosphoglycerate mutase